jgi:acetyl esterase/lipase
MEHTMKPEGVKFKQDTIGGISGIWCLPADAPADEAILHLHGGWFNWGTAKAYQNLVGHIAAKTGVNSFIPDYSLAPEHPFPTAINELEKCYEEMINKRMLRVAISGDSAGGNLALALLPNLVSSNKKLPVGVAVFSPVTDLTLTGSSYETRAEADPYFVRTQVEALVHLYLGAKDAEDSLASPLYGDFSALPPILLQVGEDEILLDDSTRYYEQALAAGVDVKLEIWQGMPHGFVGMVGQLEAATKSLDSAGAFLDNQFSSDR